MGHPGNTYKRVVCADGFNVSMQASVYAYCDPRSDSGPYSAVELGYPSEGDPLIQEYAEDQDQPTSSVYGWVPADIVRQLIAKHGGIVAGEVPPLVGGTPRVLRTLVPETWDGRFTDGREP